MHSLRSLWLATALLASQGLAAFDNIVKPTELETIEAGSTYTIEWELDSTFPTGPVSISLAGGPTHPEGLLPLGSLVQQYDNSKGKFAWNVDKSLGKDNFYGINIALESNSSVNQWSFAFKIAGSSTSSPGTEDTPESSSTSHVGVFVTSPPSTIVTSGVFVTSPPSTTVTTGVFITSPPAKSSGTGSNLTLSTPPLSSVGPSSTTSSPSSMSSNFAGRAEATMGSVLGLLGLAALLM